jgi:hypothetical protein
MLEKLLNVINRRPMSKKQDRLDKTLSSRRKLISETVAALTTSPTNTAAASLLGISNQALYERLGRYPEIKEAVDEIPQRALEILKRNTEKAANVIVGKLDDRRKDFEAAKEVLDRAGVGVKGKGVRATTDDKGNMSVEFLEFE